MALEVKAGKMEGQNKKVKSMNDDDNANMWHGNLFRDLTNT
jgi:hypothetical protein